MPLRVSPKPDMRQRYLRVKAWLPHDHIDKLELRTVFGFPMGQMSPPVFDHPTCQPVYPNRNGFLGSISMTLNNSSSMV
jgi:hypothetical protein